MPFLTGIETWLTGNHKLSKGQTVRMVTQDGSIMIEDKDIYKGDIDNIDINCLSLEANKASLKVNCSVPTTCICEKHPGMYVFVIVIPYVGVSIFSFIHVWNSFLKSLKTWMTTTTKNYLQLTN